MFSTSKEKTTRINNLIEKIKAEDEKFLKKGNVKYFVFLK